MVAAVSDDASTATRWVWIPDRDQCFVKAQFVEEDKPRQVCRVRTSQGSVVEVASSAVDKVNPAQFDRANDIAELTFLNEPSVVHNLSLRFQHGQIYTYSGLFLVAVNPYRSLDIYDSKVMAAFKNRRRDDTDPHIYAVAEHAYRQMLETGANQSVLITGESGAGKTENTKRVIQYLSSITSPAKRDTIDRRILQTNPVLEAFGNAQTIRNANSSRFGKFIRIEFGSSAIVGASIEWYLLEKSRVVTQASEERNYHVFYQLLRGADPALRKHLELKSTDPADYVYLQNGTPSIEGVDDAEQFRALQQAFDVMGFIPAEIRSIMEIVAAVLHLGQIKVGAESADQGRFLGTAEVESACRLLGVDPAQFTKAVLRPRVRAGREVVTQSKTAAQAQFALGALAKTLYERLFGFVVDELNGRLLRSAPGKTSIGVLDIAGFEIFRANSFEQLCINYTNEKLQQFFNHHMFVLEQEEYVKEDIDWDYIDYGEDLQPTIDLIESSRPMGIFACLDEDCVVPQATDKSFTDKLVERWNGRNSQFSAARLGQGFVVNHYATPVEYSTEGWLDKNRDPLGENLVELMATSTKSNVAKLFPVPDLNGATTGATAGNSGQQGNTSAGRKGKFRTVAQRHKEQLNNLMTQLETTRPHFVRCILPNKHRRSNEFDNALVLDQLRCNGVLEGIRIARAGYPNRLEFSEFCHRYHPLASEPAGGTTQRSCSAVLAKLHLDPISYKVGMSKVFFRNGVLADLEDRLDRLVQQQTLAVQTLARAKLARRRFRREMHRREATELLARTFRRGAAVANDPWWRLLVAQRPLLASEGNMDSSRKDMRISKLEMTIRSLRENVANLRSETDVLRPQAAHTSQLTRQLAETREELEATDKVREDHKRALEKARSEHSQAIEALKQQLEDQKAHGEAEIEKLKADTGELDGVRNQLAALEASYQTLQKQYKDNQRQNETSQKMHEGFQKQYEELQKKYEDLQKQHQASANIRKESDTKQNVLIAEKRGLEEKLEQLESSHQQELLKINTQHKSLQTDHKKLQDDHHSLESQQTRLESQFKNLQSEYKTVQGQHKALEGEYKTLQGEHEPLKSDYDVLKKLHRDLLAAHKHLSSEMEATKSQPASEAVQAELTELRQTVDKLRKEWNGLQRTADAHTKLLGEHEALDQRFQQLQTQHNALKEQSSHQKTALDEAEDKYKQLQAAGASTEKLQATHESTLRSLKSLQTTHDTTLSSMKQLQKTHDDTVSSMQKLQSTHETTLSSMSTLKKQYEQTQTGFKKLEADHRDLQNSHRDTLSELKKLQRAYDDVQTAYKTLKTQYGELDQSHKKLQTVHERASTSHERLQAAYEKLQAAHAALEEEYSHKLSPLQRHSHVKKSPAEDIELDLTDAKHDLAAARARVEELEREIASQTRELAQLPMLRQKIERVQREKAQLVDERSKVMFSAQDQRARSQELEVERAKAAESKKLQSEIRVLKLQVVRSERDRKALEAQLQSLDKGNGGISQSSDLERKLRAAELAKVQLQTQVQQLQTQLSMVRDAPSHRRLPSAPRAADPELVVRKRDVPRALRVISNDRRVSEQLDASKVAEESEGNVDVAESLQMWRRRAQNAHVELEKAELVVAAAVRNEEHAQAQLAELRERASRMEGTHTQEIGSLRDELQTAKSQLADLELELSVSRENANFIAELEAQVRSLSTTIGEMQGDRDRLLADKQRLEKRLGEAADLSDRPKRLAEQLASVQRDIKAQQRVADDLRWQVSRRDRLVEQLKHTVADGDAREEELREQLDHLQAAESAKDLSLRRASREAAQARQHALMLERELDAYKQQRHTPAFV